MMPAMRIRGDYPIAKSALPRLARRTPPARPEATVAAEAVAAARPPAAVVERRRHLQGVRAAEAEAAAGPARPTAARLPRPAALRMRVRLPAGLTGSRRASAPAPAARR